MGKRFLVLLLILSSPIPVHPQSTTKNEIGKKDEIEFSQTSIHFEPHVNYLGLGLTLRRFFKPSFGFEIQGSVYPQSQYAGDDKAWHELLQFTGIGLAGHRWRRVGLYAEAGSGVVRSHVAGAPTLEVSALPALRTCPDIVVGGLVDIPASAHWSLTFEGRENILKIGPWSENDPFVPYPLFDPGETLHSGEIRMGVAFRF